MKKRYHLCLAILSTCIALLGCEKSDNAAPEATAATAAQVPTAEQDQQAVKDVFETYRLALVHGDGETAVNHVSAGTIALYDKRSKLALTGTKQELLEETIATRLSALMLRHRVMPGKLRQMDGRGVFSHAVDYGWIGREAVDRLRVQTVAVNGDSATAQATAAGAQGVQNFHFVREDGGWKLDLLPMSRQSDLALAAQAREAGITNDEFLFRILSTVSGRPVTDSIWEPIGQ